MARQKPLNECTLEELHAMEKKTKTSKSVMLACVILMVILGIFQWVRVGWGFNTVMPIFFIPITLVVVNQHKKILAEIKSRG
jgi:hypothetical protein